MTSIHRLMLLTAMSATAAFAAETPKAAPATFLDALTGGKPSVNARLRYEHVEQDGFNDADALTARLRLGYATAPYKGFQALLEGEAVTPLVNDYFDGTGTNTSAYATVADPEVYQLNQAWLAYTFGQTKATAGRQRLVLDNARFIGDVGWRQNQQTFDAVVLQDKTLAKTTLTYAYLDRVNRVFDDSGAQPDFDSDSHLFNASYAGLPSGTLTGYAYLLDFDNSAANSSQTYGLSFAGVTAVSQSVKIAYRAEYATQSDYGANSTPGGYSADYYVLEAGPVIGRYALAAGYEVLGADDATSGTKVFRTPLATLHAHNGWADVFLNTPAGGLTDLYLKASAKVSGPVEFTAFYHSYGTDRAAAFLGDEVDLQAIYKLNKQLSFTAKAAKFWSAQPGAAFADRTKVWLQTDYAF